jgi:hypothetical protein
VLTDGQELWFTYMCSSFERISSYKADDILGLSIKEVTEKKLYTQSKIYLNDEKL